MVITDDVKTRIKSVFEGVYENKSQAKDLVSSANDMMKGLSESISGESGDDPKLILASLKKAYKEFVEEKESKPDTLSEAIMINNALRGM